MNTRTRLSQLGDAEARLAIACAFLVPRRASESEALALLASEHREAAARLGRSISAARGAIARAEAWLSARRRSGAIAWLAAEEHALVRAYLTLDLAPDLDDETRRQLRHELLPAAYDRFTRADRLVAARDADHAPSWYDARI